MGDVILAINNVSLKGKSLIEAIDLLKNAGDLVTLKISRKLEQNQHHNNNSQANFHYQQSPLKQHDHHQHIEIGNSIRTPQKNVTNRSMGGDQQLVVKNVTENGISSRACNTPQHNQNFPQQQSNFYGNCANEKNENSDFINSEYQKSLQYRKK